jgi:hypothetical protein
MVTSGVEAKIFIVTPEKELVWDYLPPLNQNAIVLPDDPISGRRLSIFRANYYDADYPAFDGRDFSGAKLLGELATTSDRYWGLLQGQHENTLSADVPARYYTLFVPDAEVAPNTFSVEVLDGNIDPVVTIVDRNLTPLVTDDNSGDGQNALISDYVPPNVGWLYVVVSQAGGDTTGVEGSLRLVRTFEDRFTDVAPEIPRILYGAAIQDMISDEDPESLFAFYGAAGDHVTVRMQRDNASLDPVVELLDADGNVLISAFATDPDLPVAIIEDYTLPADSVYFIRTTRYTGDDRPSDTTGVYTVELSLGEATY